METIEKLSHTLDFTDHASQIIHALVHVLDQSPELRPAAMETLCRMMTQLGQRYKIFIPMVKKVWEGGGEGRLGGGGRKERVGRRAKGGEKREYESRDSGAERKSGWREGEKRGRKGEEEKKEQKRGKGRRGKGRKQREGANTKLHCDCHLLFPGDEQTSLLSHDV